MTVRGVVGPQILISPNIDLYGSKARVSALADYVELAALLGKTVTRADLADLIADNDWTLRPTRGYVVASEVDEDPLAWADSVFAILDERSSVLAEKYPFEFKRNALKWRDSALRPIDSSYVSLLAITSAHAFSIDTSVNVEGLLERIVADTLRSMGLGVASVGVTDRKGGFVEAVQQAGLELGLAPDPDPRPRSVSAKDEGVDTVAGLVWRDGRRGGHFLFIGQVTVGKSDTWKSKLKEPEGKKWAGYLREDLFPQAFLAIPHHVEAQHVTWMMASDAGVVIDRLRIVLKKPPNSSDEVLVIEGLLACDIE